MRFNPSIYLALLALLLVAGCGDAADEYRSDSGQDWNGGSDASAGGDWWAGDEDDGVQADPEPELTTRIMPVASQRYVYVANEEARLVAKVDALTLAVQPILLEVPPHVVVASQQDDNALVLSRGAERLYLIRSEPERDEVVPLRTVRGNNSLALSPDGRWAIAYYDNSISRPGEPIGSLQEVTLVDVREGTTAVLSTGFGIRHIGFSADSEQVFILTESGVHRFEPADIEGNQALPIVPLALGELGVAPELAVSADSSVLLIRDPLEPRLLRVDLSAGDIGEVLLDEVASQLLVLAGGEEVAATQPETQQLAIVDFEIEGAPVRSIEMPQEVTRLSLDETSGEVLGWSTSESSWVRLSLAPTQSQLDVFNVRAPASTVVPLPGQSKAIVLHAQVAHEAAMTVFDLSSSYGKFIQLGALPRQVIAAEGSNTAWIRLEGGAAANALHRVDLDTFARLEVQFDATPETFGLMPGGGQLYVSLADETGRLAFVDAVTGEYRQVAGYLLNAFIE